MKLLPLILVAGLITCLSVMAAEWEVVDPDGQGMDASVLAELTTQLASGELGQIDGVAVLRNGQMVYREYFRGYQGENLPVYSVTKSVGSILMGTLKRDGLITTDDLLVDYFDQYAGIQFNSHRAKITIADLLKQRHGQDWNEWPYSNDPNHPIATMLNSPDWLRTVISWPMAGDPDLEFRYSTGASTLMSGIILHATGQTPQVYAREQLFDPLGISSSRWAINVLESRDVAIEESGFPDGIAPLGFSLWLDIDDMATIGQMMLNGGVLDGKRIVTEDWISESTATYSDMQTDPQIFTSPTSGHGYQWWLTTFVDSQNREFESYYANGYGRQYIFVIPGADMVVVSLAADYNREGPGMGAAMREYILPAIKSSSAQFPLSSRLNGSWFDQATPGQGINLEVLESRDEALVYWYTYDSAGNQQWMIGQGPIIDDVAQLGLLTAQGGRLNRPDPPTLSAWGTATLRFDSCLAGQFDYASEGGDESGTINLSRLTGLEACQSARGKFATFDVP